MNVGAPKALWTGARRSLRNWRLWLIFYALNFLLAAVLALPFADVFMKSVSKSLAGSDLLSGFSYRWYVEFIHTNGSYFSSLVPQIILLFVIYIMIEVFFAGGFFSAFSSEGKTRVSSFFSEGASKFSSLLAVTLVEILALLLLYEIDAVWAAADKDAARKGVTDFQVLHAELWRYAAVAVVFVLINMISDFIRAAVATIRSGRPGSCRSWCRRTR